MNSPKHFFAAVLSTLIWGFFSIPLRAMKQFPSEQILYFRVFLSFVIVVLVCLIFRKQSIKADVQHIKNLDRESKMKMLWKTLGVSLLVTCNWFSFIFVVNHVSLKSAAFAYMICPIITALAAYFILKEHLTRIKFIAIFISIVSVSLMAVGIYQEVLYSILVASLYAFYLIIQKGIEGINKFNFLAIQFGISSIILIPLFILSGGSFPTSFYFWWHIFIISVFFTIIPLFLSLYALAKIPSSTIGIIIYLNPIISFSIAFLYFKEKASLLQIISYEILFMAVLIFNWEFIKELYSKGKSSAKIKFKQMPKA